VVVAAPVAAPQACAQLAEEADELVADYTPEPFYSVGLWYADFAQNTEEEVRDLLAQAAEARPRRPEQD